jgi:hypothetical protein
MNLIRKAALLYKKKPHPTYTTKQWFFGMFALFFLAQAVFNIGCCGTSGCNAPQKKDDNSNEPLDYEEVK